MADDGGGAAPAALDAGLPRGEGVPVAEGINEVGEPRPGARGIGPGAAAMHDDTVEQGAVVEHIAGDPRERLGDLNNLELGVEGEGGLEEMKKEKKKKKKGGGEVEQRERFQDGEKKKEKGGGCSLGRWIPAGWVRRWCRRRPARARRSLRRRSFRCW